MCRWFAYISPTEPCLLEDVLITPKNSLSKQVHAHYLPLLIAHKPEDLQDADHLTTARNSIYNIDGLGLAWYTNINSDFEVGNGAGLQKQGLRPALYKTTQPPANDMNFRSICANTETKACLAHIRAASGTPIVAVNNHPFVFGRHTFMHNGVISDFSSIKRSAAAKMSQAAFDAVHGSTDSEHLAALYITYLTQGGDETSFEREYLLEDMAVAMHRAVGTIIDLQKAILGSRAAPNSLNLCATDGVKLCAFRFRNHATEQPPSLYFSDRAGVTLNRKYPDHPDGMDAPGRETGIPEERHGKHLIVASEPSTYKQEDWQLIGKNQYVVVAPGVFEVRDILYESGWDAQDTDA